MFEVKRNKRIIKQALYYVPFNFALLSMSFITRLACKVETDVCTYTLRNLSKWFHQLFQLTTTDLKEWELKANYGHQLTK